MLFMSLHGSGLTAYTMKQLVRKHENPLKIVVIVVLSLNIFEL